jgi:membrane protease YdiL (CAAX protease family)
MGKSKCTCTFEDFVNGECEMENEDLIKSCNFNEYQEDIVNKNSFWKKYNRILAMIVESIMLSGFLLSSIFSQWWVFNVSMTISLVFLIAIFYYGFSKKPKVGLSFVIILVSVIVLIWVFIRKNYIIIYFNLSNPTIPVFKPITLEYVTDLFMYLGIIVFGLVVISAIISLLQRIWEDRKKSKTEEQLEDFNERDNPALNDLTDFSAVSIIFIIILIPVAAFTEEIVFRWGFINLFHDNVGVLWAVVISSIIFGLGHAMWGLDDFIVTTFIGLLLSIIFLDWGVIGSTIPHMIWNFVAITIDYYQSKDLNESVSKTVVFG